MRKDHNREKALAALLNSVSVPEAAKACGLSATTLRRYKADPAFAAEFRAAKREILDDQMNRLRQVHLTAIETIERNMNCENPAVEVRAAQIVLEQVRKDFETSEILDRIEALEREMQTEDE